MKTKFVPAATAFALALSLTPTTALGAQDVQIDDSVQRSSKSALVALSEQSQAVDDVALSEAKQRNGRLNRAFGELCRAMTEKVERENLVLSYDRALIKRIGTQESTGHSICCPSFSCAYADAVMDGTVRDHSYYTCGCCSWRDWGGGNSSFRNAGVGTPQLREAYDQINQGRPVVIHVRASYGEHWIALIGYQNAKDPDNLTLDNFVALDPWDGAQIVASERFRLYGDGCQHISSRV